MTSGGDSDDVLVERARDGDEDAFAALYRRHRDWVLRVATRMTGSSDDALDILQESFAYLFRKLADPTFRLSATIRGLLYPTVRHLAFDRLRRRRPEVDVDLLADVLPDRAVAPGVAPDLQAALATLPPPQREVLILRFVDDLSLQQIAEVSGVPLGTVKSRLHHALAAIRRALGKE